MFFNKLVKMCDSALARTPVSSYDTRKCLILGVN